MGKHGIFTWHEIFHKNQLHSLYMYKYTMHNYYMLWYLLALFTKKSTTWTFPFHVIEISNRSDPMHCFKHVSFPLVFFSLQRNPIGSLHGISTYIYHKNQPNVGKYTIHGSLGNDLPKLQFRQFQHLHSSCEKKGWRSWAHFPGDLVGGRTHPSEKYARQIGSFLQVEVNIKHIWNHQLVI